MDALSITWVFPIHAVGMVAAVALASRLPVVSPPMRVPILPALTKLFGHVEFCLFLSLSAIQVGWVRCMCACKYHSLSERERELLAGASRDSLGLWFSMDLSASFSAVTTCLSCALT